MIYEYNKIIHKIKKYKMKYNSTNIINKQRYYIQKIKYYNQYINHQYGGNDMEKTEGLPNLIRTHQNNLGEDVERTIKTATFNGIMSIVQLYNRALSETEVLQNWNALKGRFGL